MGLSFRMASKVIKALPSVFLIARLDNPIRHSQNPPYHGGLLGINCHSTPCLLRKVKVTGRVFLVPRPQTSRWKRCPTTYGKEEICGLRSDGMLEGSFSLLSQKLLPRVPLLLRRRKTGIYSILSSHSLIAHTVVR